LTELYHDGDRRLHDQFDTRRLADRIEERIVRDHIHAAGSIEPPDRACKQPKGRAWAANVVAGRPPHPKRRNVVRRRRDGKSRSDPNPRNVENVVTTRARLSPFRQTATPNGTRGSSKGLKRHSSEIRISSAKLTTTRRPVARC